MSGFRRSPSRILTIVLGTLVFLVVGAVYPVLARGPAWRGVTWGSPLWGLALLLVPLALWKMTDDSRVARLRLPTLYPLVRGPRGWRTRLRDLPSMVRSAALVFAIVALARPQSTLRGESAEERGIDIIVVLDLSGSMKAIMDGPARDVPKNVRVPNAGYRLTRLDTAKEVILDFLSRRRTDRMGVVVFGRAAYVLSPPTLDYTLLANLVQKMSLDLIDGSGTAIGDAVGTGVARLRRSDARSKAIVLLTDGDSNAGSVSPEYATHLAKAQAVKVYTVQIGNGDEVDVQEGTDLFGQPRYTRQRYPVNPALLKTMASETGGEAFVASDRAALEESMHNILDKLEKTRFEAQMASVEELFPFLLIPAALLAVAEALLRILVVRRFP